MSKRQASIAAIVLFYAGLGVALVGIVRVVNHEALGGTLCGAGLALVVVASWISGRGRAPDSPSRDRESGGSERPRPAARASHDRSAAPSRLATAEASRT